MPPFTYSVTIQDHIVYLSELSFIIFEIKIVILGSWFPVQHVRMLEVFILS